MNTAIDKYLDTCGLMCPEPVMMLHKAIRGMSQNEIIEVKATDPSTQRDIAKFCQFLGHEMINSFEQDGVFIYVIKKGQKPI